MKEEPDTVEGTATAADQAHHLGLRHSGYGYWDDQQGNTVARTIKGHLVKLEKSEETPAKEPAQAQEPEHPDMYHEPEDTTPEIEHLDPHNLRRQIHPQEVTETVDTSVMTAFYNAAEYSRTDAIVSERFAEQQSIEQDKTWRQHLIMTGDYYRLLRTQTWWQRNPQFYASKSDRDMVNATFDRIIKNAKELPKTKSVIPIERGITVPEEDLEKYLSMFKVGEDVPLPYSGFSSDPSLARDFAHPADARHAGVVLRIHPNENKEIYGIHLSNVNPIEDDDEEKTIDDFNQTAEQYNEEKEIIRIPQSKTRCKGIKKMMSKKTPLQMLDTDSRDFLEVVYVIDLEEAGPGEQQNESSDDTHKHMVANNPIFEFYMNSCFRQEDPKETVREIVKEVVSKLINEVTPAEQAHHLGLISAGGAYWADQHGTIVAKTQGDHLIQMTPAEYQKEKDAENKAQDDFYYGDYGKFASPANTDWTKPFTPPKSTLPPSKPVTQEEANNPNTPIIWTNGSNGVQELNGVPFTPWEAPKEIDDWKTVEGQLDFDEPEFVNPPSGSKWPLKPSAGCVIMEPDGRVWIVEPLNHFGGYEHGFPKGGQEPELTLQQTAIKETFEETGLKVEITGFHSDVEGQTTLTRLYMAKRVSGTPDEHGWESQAVKLVPLKDLKKYRRKSPVKYGVATASNIMDKKIGTQQGTNLGGFYEGKDGVKRYVKFYKDPDRGETEVLANNFYRDVGIAAPESNTFLIQKGKGHSDVAFASDIIPGKELNQVKLTPELAKKILDGFIADIMMANYDAVGLEHDNIIVDEQGNPIRIDQGGSLLFRAMESSGRKKENMLDGISEWDGLQDPSINPAYAKVWKAAGVKANSPEMVEKWVDQIKKIHQLKKKYGGWDKYIRAASPYLSKKDAKRVTQMMDSREKLLIKKIANLKGIPV